MHLRRISGLAASIVPHRQWAVSRWFYANPIWYYHRLSAAHHIRPTGKFYQLIDPELRDVCRLLHEAHIRTTPSCQGHFYPRERFENIWEELQREAQLIHGAGLVVKDCEDDHPYLFADPAYTVPWKSREAFIRQATAHQTMGYLGILLPWRMNALASNIEAFGGTEHCSTTRDDSLGFFLGGMLVAICVNSRTPTERTRIWRKFTEHIGTLLDRWSAQTVKIVKERHASVHG